MSSLLADYKNAEPLPTTLNADGKSLANIVGPKSSAYDEFPKPIDPSNNGFDFHSEFFNLLQGPALLRICSLLHARK